MSLWDIVKLFNVEQIAALVKGLENGRTQLETSRLLLDALPPSLLVKDSPAFQTVVQTGKATFLQVASTAEKVCWDSGLTNAATRISEMHGGIAQHATSPDISMLLSETNHIVAEILRDLRSRQFIAIDAERNYFVDRDDLLGRPVADAFPSAVPDIREAGNCLAADCNTAAVFHLMRAVEWGLRALAADLGLKQVKHKIKKSGRVLYTPIAYSEWERILDDLQERVDAKIATLKRGTKKQELQQFYYPALRDIRGIRDAWRNHVMHTRDEYNAEDADAVFTHVKRLMNALAGRIAEV